MKKQLIVSIFMLLPLMMSAQAITDGTWNAVVNIDNTATITGLAAGSGVSRTGLNIPSSITSSGITYPVTRIGAGAFMGYANITGDVVVPEGVAMIDDQVFAGCVGLRSITFKTASPISFVNTTGATAKGSFAGAINLEYIDMSASGGVISANTPVLNRATTPTGLPNAYPFYGLPTHTIVYLPKDLVDVMSNHGSYTFTVTPTLSPGAPMTTTGNYSITSNYNDGTTTTPVPWTIVGYSADGSTYYPTPEAAGITWLTDGILIAGAGGSGDATGSGTITANLPPPVSARDLGLANAAQRGTSAAPYDLSTHDVNGNVTAMNTANCYVISAPGYYELPLVYGNAIVGGVTNSGSYTSTATGTGVITNFVDSKGANITQPYIGSVYTPTTAGIVWADAPNLVTGLAIKGSGSGAYLTFQVPRGTPGLLGTGIQSGNAVVEVRDASGALWSWQLWFAPSTALDKVQITSTTGVKYYFATEQVGFIPGEPSTQQRKVVIRIRQAMSGNTATLTITQAGKPGTVSTPTTYQFGRKDAFPGAGDPGVISNGVGQFSIIASKVNTATSIANPSVYYTTGPSQDWNSTSYINQWSVNNSIIESSYYNDYHIVKSVYDPCPVGFHVPASGAFSAFKLPNSTLWDNGYELKTNNPVDGSLFIAASGFRYYDTGGFKASPTVYGDSWYALPAGATIVSSSKGGSYNFSKTNIVNSTESRSDGLPISAVADD